MNRIYAIARNTLRETIRDKIVYVVIFFMVLGLLASQLITPLTMGEQIKIVQDLSLAFLSFFSVLLVILVGTSLLRKEMEGRTIYLVLSRPVKRYEFIIGKFIGMVMFDIVVIVIMSAGAFVNILLVNKGIYYSMWYFHEFHYFAIAVAMFFVLMQLIILNAVSIFFSVISSSSIISAIFTFFVYLAGISTDTLKQLAETARSPMLLYITKFFYYVLPNFAILDLKNNAIYGVIPSLSQSFFLIGYTVFYSVCLLLFAVLIFEGKELK
ncbi:MAG: ABC transporter permease [bacterium]